MVLFSLTISANSYARTYLNVEPNQTWTAPTNINQLSVGGRLTLINATTNVAYRDDTQDNIHHSFRCGTEGLSFSNNYINIGSTDYRLELYIDGQRKNHCNTGSTHPNFFGPFYDVNTNKNVNIQLVLVRISANANETTINLPDHMSFCMSNAEDGAQSQNCGYTSENDFRYYFRTTAGSRSIGISVNKDYGDAGGNYRTLVSENGPSHEPSNNLFIGETVADTESGLVANTTATSDDNTSTDDEDTPSIVNFYANSTSLSSNQSVKNSTGSTAYIYSWVDWDNNGTFDRDEFVDSGLATGGAIQVNNNATQVNLSWYNLPSLSDNQQFMMRTRITPNLLTDSAVGAIEDPRSYGDAGIGEVEDHIISVTAAGELPDIVTCSVASQAINGREIAELPIYNEYAGVNVVGDELRSDTARGSSQPSKRFDLQVLAPNQTFNYPIEVEAEFRLRNLRLQDGDFLFWLTDHQNMNGVLITDSSNSFAGQMGLSGTWNGNNARIANFGGTLTYLRQMSGILDTSYKRYRIRMTVDASNSVQMQLTILEDNGTEILQSPVVTGSRTLNPSQGIWLAHTSHTNDPAAQKYIFGGVSMVVSDNNGCDYGDAPDIVTGSNQDDYETLALNSGPSHTIVDDMYLGTTAPDADDDGFHDGTDNNNNATDDDVKGSVPDDEDAVTNLTTVTSSTYSLDVTCNDYSALNGNLGGIVYGWIDANRNGLFEESEAAQAQCIDNSAAANGNASLSWSNLSIQGGTSYLRLRITDTNLVDLSTSDTKDDRAYGSVNHGEVEDHQILIAPTVSGYVYHDDGSNSAIRGNGTKESGEQGLAGVTVTLYNDTDKQCTSIDTTDGSIDANGDGVINSDDIGFYQFIVEPNKTYSVFETANAITPINCATGPPSQGIINTSTGAVTENVIADLELYISTSSNQLQLGQVNTDIILQNFGDLQYTSAFPTCDTNAYLAKNNPSQLFSVNLVTTDETLIGSANSGLYNAIGYSVRQNLIFGVAAPSGDVIVLNANGELINSFDVPELNGFSFPSGDVTDDDKLVLVTNSSSGRRVMIVDVNPASPTYMQYIGQSTNTNQTQGDIAIHPINGSVWAINWGSPDRLIQFNIDFNSAATTVTDFGDTNITTGDGPGAVYFDNLGYLYASINNTGELYRFDITNPSSPNLNGVLIATGNIANGNDGARCRYAPVPLDFADAPNDFLTLFADGGPRHQTDVTVPYLGTEKPDNENDGQPTTAADGDDVNGLTPDDEDGLIIPTITQFYAEDDKLVIQVKVVSSGNDNLHGWIDFDNDKSFSDTDEKATTVVTASGELALEFTVPADIVQGETYIRLRTCSTNTNCATASGPASDGEVEDHALDLTPYGDLQLVLTLDPVADLTVGVPFNIVVGVENLGDAIAYNTKVTLPIPAGYSYVRAYEAMVLRQQIPIILQQVNLI
ncbi:GEVED domain-containing protein [Shewanella marina]|uniref:GEVED domain-containing protein n=1 Tax=Shewanella marina TaxID=487319 RepID=UPI0004709BD7|nr:GEVED domain-containing protein [Shewanella marina]